jgi:hypothetical protein
MSTHYGMPRNENDVFAALNFEVKNEELIETGSITFPDGYCIELVKDRFGSPALCGSRNKKFLQRIKRAGHVFVPPIIAPSVLEALTFPQKRTDCGSIAEMFGEIGNFFLSYGVSEDAARACTYFAFAS